MYVGNENTEVDISDVIPIYKRYAFAGWDINFTGVIARESVTMDAKKVLYAIWELAPTEGTGEWKLIDGTSIFSVKFNDEINIKGKVYFYDEPDLTKTYYVNGDSNGYMSLEGSVDFGTNPYYRDTEEEYGWGGSVDA